MKIKIVLILMMLCTSANAQDKIVPMTLYWCWPISIPMLDSVYYYESKAIALNKVKIREEYDEKEKRISQTFFNRMGKPEKILKYICDTLSSETTYERNSWGQITHEYTIFNQGDKKLTTEEYYTYDDFKPYSKRTVKNGSANDSSSVIYMGDTLSGILLNGNFLIDVVHEKGNIFVGKYPYDENCLVYIQQRQDTVIINAIGSPMETYIINNHLLLSISYDNAIDNRNITKFIYDSKNLLIYKIYSSLNIDIITNSNPLPENYSYKYSYYED